MNYEDRDTYGMYKGNINGQANGNGNGNGISSNGDAKHGPGPEIMGANTLLGNDVYNHKAEELGDIKEIMLDMRTGRIDYVVLSFGGFLKMGEKLFAVPWSALTLDTQNKCFVLNVEKERLEHAPGFDKDKWPNMADQTWANEVHTYYGTKPYSKDLRL